MLLCRRGEYSSAEHWHLQLTWRVSDSGGTVTSTQDALGQNRQSGLAYLEGDPGSETPLEDPGKENSEFL